MGNYKFRLADMMPNAWFYKLRDMSKKPRNQISSQTLNQKITKKKKKSNTLHNSSSSYSSSSPSTTTTTTVSSKPNQPHQHSPRKSYYFTRDLNPRDYPNSPINPSKSHNFSDDLPRKSSSKQRPRRRRSAAKQSPKQLSAGGAGLDSVWTKSDSSSEFTPESSPEKEFSGEREFRCDGILSTKKVCSCRDDHQGNNCNKEATDIVIDVDKASLAKPPESPPGQFESFAKLELPPIITKQSAKPKKKDKNNNHHNSNSNNNNTSSSPGIRLRMNHSPRIVNKRVSGLKKSAAAANTRRSRSLSDSFAVVKCSSDPQRDFKDSMMEMIVENNIRASKDLEDLLACYLSLNSDEYHGMIIKVFKQIWFDLSDVS